jgi:hypothetical protein
VAGKTVKQSFKISFITNAIDSTKDDIWWDSSDLDLKSNFEESVESVKPGA